MMFFQILSLRPSLTKRPRASDEEGHQVGKMCEHRPLALVPLSIAFPYGAGRPLFTGGQLPSSCSFCQTQTPRQPQRMGDGSNIPNP
jgi:hypothetical protein